MIVQVQDGEVEKRYKFGRTLGHGTFATVKLATYLSDNTQWAIKVIKRSALTSEDEESLRMEIQILQLTNHPNIVSVKEVFYCKNYVYLVMDLMTGGELFDRIVLKDHYNEQEAKHALKQIVVALHYCHDHNIVHRDLKPENILYQNTSDDSPLKLADFGLAMLLRPNQMMTVACGTPGYVAPEILRGLAYGKEVDMWSIGVILYILLCGFPPFYDDNNKKLFQQIVSASYTFPDPYWTNISANAKDLIKKLLVIDPQKRLSAEEVLKHPWMFEDNSSSKLDHFRPNMKSYNAKRRLRSAIRAVQITQLLRKRPGQTPPKSILEAVESHDHNIRSQSIDNYSECRDDPASSEDPRNVIAIPQSTMQQQQQQQIPGGTNTGIQKSRSKTKNSMNGKFEVFGDGQGSGSDTNNMNRNDLANVAVFTPALSNNNEDIISRLDSTAHNEDPATDKTSSSNSYQKAKEKEELCLTNVPTSSVTEVAS